MPSPEFNRSFPIGRTIFALTFRMQSVVPIRGGSNQSAMSKYYPITTRLRKLLYFASAVHANCLRTVALDGIRNSRFSTFNQNSSKKETTTHDSPIYTRVCHPFELLVNCKFALRGYDSFRPSEPKETIANSLNACNVKWPVYSTNTATARLR